MLQVDGEIHSNMGKSIGQARYFLIYLFYSDGSRLLLCLDGGNGEKEIEYKVFLQLLFYMGVFFL